MPIRLTARLRLTLLYAALFCVAGVILLGLNYALMRRGLERSPDFLLSTTFVRWIGADDETAPPPTDVVTTLPAPRSDEIEREQARLRQAALHELVVQSAIALAVAVAVSTGLGWWLAGRALRPVHEITAVARRLSQERLDERIALRGPRDELKELADTFDAMLDRLQAAFVGQRRFAANASHELRTPLAVMRTEIDVTLADPDATAAELRAMGETVRAATIRSERLIDGLLLLARGQQELVVHEPVDLVGLVTEALARATGEIARRGLRIESALHAAPVAGDPALLAQVATNLLDNAIRYNVDGGWLRVTTGFQAERATLTVTNGGPVIPPEAVATLFEPFRRLGADRTGSVRGAGLGLSIVQAVAAAHGGEVRARALPTGGLEVTVAFGSRQ